MLIWGCVTSTKGLTSTVVEQVAKHSQGSETETVISWVPTAKECVKLALVPPAGTKLVRTGVPSTVHSMANGSPSASATFAERVVAAQPAEVHCTVIGAG